MTFVNIIKFGNFLLLRLCNFEHKISFQEKAFSRNPVAVQLFLKFVLFVLLEFTALMFASNEPESFDLQPCVTGEGQLCGNLKITEDATSFVVAVTFMEGASATGRVQSIFASVNTVVTKMELDEFCG